ncbi:hypothetical protein evm_013591 [Chilo suppressalis]|nr:hypothetical protein evm_013591 [Chilo suppressalis]
MPFSDRRSHLKEQEERFTLDLKTSLTGHPLPAPTDFFNTEHWEFYFTETTVHYRRQDSYVYFPPPPKYESVTATYCYNLTPTCRTGSKNIIIGHHREKNWSKKYAEPVAGGMEARGGVRSSARLSGEGARNQCNGSNGRPERPNQDAAAAAAAAALRRARAAERAREVEDSPRVLREKCRRLARALRNAKHLVVYTGAGISTAADIPDYRGPHGVWTRLQRGETVGRVEVSRAQPTFTHMALTALWARGTLKFVVSQNCDGLHIRAGLPRRALAELHGDMFAELCGPCRRVYLRAFDTTERTARHAHGTRRLCHACGAELRDSIVHFGERGRAAWPLNWAGALRHAAQADVVLCLGSSLKVLRRYPRLWRMQAAPRDRPALYIVNLQWTPKDSVAALKINARCDAVMRHVARRLRLRVPHYRPHTDPLLAHAEPLAPPELHTTRRPLLSRPSPSPRLRPRDLSDENLSSPSASDSDEELPLRRLAERLRAPPSPKTNDRSSPENARRKSGDRSSPNARFRDNERPPSPQKRFLLPNTHPPPVPDERLTTPNHRPPSPMKRPPSLYELLASPYRQPPLPKMRFLSPNTHRPPPYIKSSVSDDRVLPPNMQASLRSERLTTPFIKSPLMNARVLPQHMEVPPSNERLTSPHTEPLFSDDRVLPQNMRVSPQNERLTGSTVQPSSPNDRVLPLNMQSPPPNELFTSPRIEPPLSNHHILPPKIHVPPPNDQLTLPTVQPPLPNDRVLPPNMQVPPPNERVTSPQIKSPLSNDRVPPIMRIPSPNERLSSPTIPPPLPNERLSPTIQPHLPNERLLPPNMRVPSPTQRLTSPDTQPPLTNERLSPTIQLPSPNERLLSPATPPLLPNDSLLSSTTKPLLPNDSLLSPTTKPLLPNDCVLSPSTQPPLLPNDRLVPPNVQAASPESRLASPQSALSPSPAPSRPQPPPAPPEPPPAPPPARPASPEPPPARPASPQPPPTPAQPPPVIIKSPPPTTRPPPDLLRAFQVSMRSGEATILLRAQHAPPAPAPGPPAPPSPGPPAPGPPAPPAPGPPATPRAPPAAPASLALRSFRMVRPRPPLAFNGNCAPKLEHFAVKKEEPDPEPFGPKKEEERTLAKTEVGDLKKEEGVVKMEIDGANGTHGLRSKLRRLLQRPEDERLKAEGGEEALAAAYFARAVLVCRAQLYSGLHTIISPPLPAAGAPPPPAPPAPAPAPAAAPAASGECTWCLRRHGARRCLWYGPPRCTPLERRARRRRLLCACCDPATTPPPPSLAPAPAPAPPPPPALDTSGCEVFEYRCGALVAFVGEELKAIRIGLFKNFNKDRRAAMKQRRLRECVVRGVRGARRRWVLTALVAAGAACVLAAAARLLAPPSYSLTQDFERVRPADLAHLLADISANTHPIPSAVEKLTKIWKDRRITRNTKARLMRCLVFPIFLYGAETWTLRMRDRRKIDALEMWCWRRMLRIPWTAHRTNVSILKELQIKKRLSSTVQIRILKFFGHITRNEESMERLVVQGKVEGKRSRGRSPTRWTDLIKSVTRSSINDNSHSAKHRASWRRITKEAVAQYSDRHMTTTTLTRVND